MKVAPRRILASLLLFRTRALHGGGDGPDQMMAQTTLALYPLAFLPLAEPKLATILSDVIGNVPWACLQWFANSKTGSESGWKWREGSRY